MIDCVKPFIARTRSLRCLDTRIALSRPIFKPQHFAEGPGQRAENGGQRTEGGWRIGTLMGAMVGILIMLCGCAGDGMRTRDVCLAVSEATQSVERFNEWADKQERNGENVGEARTNVLYSYYWCVCSARHYFFWLEKNLDSKINGQPRDAADVLFRKFYWGDRVGETNDPVLEKTQIDVYGSAAQSHSRHTRDAIDYWMKKK